MPGMPVVHAALGALAAHGRNARARRRRGLRGAFRRWRLRPGPLAGRWRAAMIAEARAAYPRPAGMPCLCLHLAHGLAPVVRVRPRPAGAEHAARTALCHGPAAASCELPHTVRRPTNSRKEKPHAHATGVVLPVCRPASDRPSHARGRERAPGTAAGAPDAAPSRAGRRPMACPLALIVPDGRGHSGTSGRNAVHLARTPVRPGRLAGPVRVLRPLRGRRPARRAARAVDGGQALSRGCATGAFPHRPWRRAPRCGGRGPPAGGGPLRAPLMTFPLKQVQLLRE